MPVNHKFGQVTLEHPGQIAEDEPVFILAAHDEFAVELMLVYQSLRAEAGASNTFLADLDIATSEVEAWQAAHGTVTPRGV